jgi:Cu(I)/Ag(I) efflux system membrane fusion protein
MATEPVSSSAPADAASHTGEAAARLLPPGRLANAAWWLKLVLQPLLFLGFLAAGFAALGVVQKLGWFRVTSDGDAAVTGGEATATSYICPMMCTPPSPEPGRCPVCGMELVPAAAGGGHGDGHSVTIEAATRRVAGIETVAAKSLPRMRPVRSVGRLDHDEGGMKSLTAYVDGRIERLFADYTGVVVAAGDTLAEVYSPALYSAQTELLLARKTLLDAGAATLPRVADANAKLYASSRQRLIEMGVTTPQLEALEQAGVADSRLNLMAPISGTVVGKMAVEGQYVREGDVIYQLADLSSLWLMLDLFPEDAALVHYGARVEAEVQSHPGEVFSGRVSFVDPVVDPQTRTVGVRVVMPNPDGRLRLGDYAKATIELQLGEHGSRYDPELAGRWISPRHPHVIADAPGNCPICGVPLVPASSLGFTDDPSVIPEVVVIPRDAVLMAGRHSVVYVETEPGRFELRPVSLGATVDDEVVVREGLSAGEQVARRGNFLIDSQMQLVGNPSLIDPERWEPPAALVQPALTTLPPMGVMKLVASEDEDEDTADTGAVAQPMKGVPPVHSGPMRLVPPDERVVPTEDALHGPPALPVPIAPGPPPLPASQPPDLPLLKEVRP